MKASLRDLAAALLHRSGASLPGRTAAGRLAVATFHRVLPEEEQREYPLRGLAVTPDELSRFLRFFCRHYDCGTLADTASRWGSGRAGRPLLALTFDDCQLDGFLHAAPVLEAFDVRASFFAPVENVDRNETLWHDRLAYGLASCVQRDGRQLAEVAATVTGATDLASAGVTIHAIVARAKHEAPAIREQWLSRLEELCGQDARPSWDGLMSWEQLAELTTRGHEIGSHSMTHALLDQCEPDVLAHEVGESRRILASRLGVPVESFCYPNGNLDARVRDAVHRAGYRWAVGTGWRANDRGCDPLDLGRFEMDSEHAQDRRGAFSEARIAWRMSGLHPGLE